MPFILTPGISPDGCTQRAAAAASAGSRWRSWSWGGGAPAPAGGRSAAGQERRGERASGQSCVSRRLDYSSPCHHITLSQGARKAKYPAINSKKVWPLIFIENALNYSWSNHIQLPPSLRTMSTTRAPPLTWLRPPRWRPSSRRSVLSA